MDSTKPDQLHLEAQAYRETVNTKLYTWSRAAYGGLVVKDHRDGSVQSFDSKGDKAFADKQSYSGQLGFKNDLRLTWVEDYGATPAGGWVFTEYAEKHPRLGLGVLKIEPLDATETYGRLRETFWWHGESGRAMPPIGYIEEHLPMTWRGNASKGCEIYGNANDRRAIRALGLPVMLWVVP